jgi:hypothetical protein
MKRPALIAVLALVSFGALSCAPMDLPPLDAPKNKQVKIKKSWGRWKADPPTVVFTQPAPGDDARVEWHFAKKQNHCAVVRAKPAQPPIFEGDRQEFFSPPGSTDAISTPLKTARITYPAYWAYNVLIIDIKKPGSEPCTLQDGSTQTGQLVVGIDPAVCVKGAGGGCTFSRSDY